MFEGILLELPLAGFFLKKFRAGAWCDVNDLPTLDAELYRNLMVLRDYQGDAADLALTFTVADSTLGAHREVRSKPCNFEASSPHNVSGNQMSRV
jgi:HECT-domain (ubiquitin-transferase)